MKRVNLKHLIFLFFLLISLLSFSQSANQFYKQGKKAAADGKPDEAIDLFSKAIAISGADYDYLIARAKQYDVKKDALKALADYNAALGVYAKDEQIYLRVADLNIQQNNYKEAVQVLRNLLIYDDSNIEGIEKMATSLIKIREYEEAIRICFFAINNNPRKNDFYFHYYIAIAKDSMKDYLFACAEYDTALTVRQRNDNQKTPVHFLKPYYFNYSLALTNAKRYDDAIKYYSMALTLDARDSLKPENSKIYYNRSFPYSLKANYNDAIGDLTRAVMSNSNEKGPVYQRGLMYQKTHQFLNAISDYTKYLQLETKNPEAYNNRGLCFMELGNYKDAVTDFKKAVSIGKQDQLKNYNAFLADAQKKLYDANREPDPPEIALEYPIVDKDNFINVLENQYEVLVKGHIKDKSAIEFIKINGINCLYNKEEINPEFVCHVKLNEDLRNLNIMVSDVYHNEVTKTIKVGHIVSESKMKVDFAGKILSDDDARTPYSDKDIYMVNSNDEIFMQNRTDASGYFRFTNLPVDQNYFLKMDVSDSPLAMKEKFIITDKNNKPILSSSEDGKQRFKFQILPTDVNTMALMTIEEEPVLIDIKGKMFGSDEGRKPLANTMLQLLNGNGDVVSNKKTDDNGAFIFSKLPPREDYTIRTDAEESKSILFNKIVMTDDKGKIIKEMVRNASGVFEYKFLPTDKNQMAKISEVDPWLKALDLSKYKKEMIIIENIYYSSGSAEILPEAEVVLQKAVDAMKKNLKIKIEVQSHTDAVAGDDYNMELSQKRAATVIAYMIKNGIDKNRLTGKGFGETQLTNRCANGVDCSDAEHKQNRRTVFKIDYVGQ